MSLLPNVFSDAKLRARQDQLDGAWQALYNLRCDGLPASTEVEFTSDFENWRAFYDSESDWSQDSKRATDEWQTKAQDWTKRFAALGCGGGVLVDGINVISSTGDKGIPTIKDNPADDKTLFEQAQDAASALTKPARDAASTVGWVVVGVVVLVIVALAYVLTRGKASGFGVKVG